MIRTSTMSNAGEASQGRAVGPRATQAGGHAGAQRGTALLGLAGGMLVVAGGLTAGYFVLGDRGVASAATAPAAPAAAAASAATAASTSATPASLAALLAREVTVKAASGTEKLSWSALGVEIDPDEAARIGGADVAALAGRGSLPVRVDRDKAVKALLALKARTDKNAINAYLDLEARQIHDDTPGLGLDVWGSLPRLLAAARQARPRSSSRRSRCRRP